MADLDIPTVEPTLATAGDRWEWDHTHPDFPASAWTLSYAMVGSVVLNWDAAWSTPDGDTFEVRIPTTATARLEVGSYRVWRMYTQAGDRRSVELPRLQVVGDPALLEAGELASHAATMLPLVEAALQAFAENGALQYYSIGRRIYQRSQLPDLLRWRASLKAELAAERYGTRQGLTRKIKFAFGGPTEARP